MAKNGKTEAATPRRRSKAREEGSVLRSKELGVFVNVLSFACVALLLGNWFVYKCYMIIVHAFAIASNGGTPTEILKKVGVEAVVIMAVVFAVSLSFQLAAHMVQVGFLFSAKIILPKPKRLNPKNYFENLISRKNMVDMLRSIVLMLVLGFIGYLAISKDIVKIAGVTALPWQESLRILWGIFRGILMKMLLALFVIGAADYIYQKWEYEEKLKMTKDERRREQKDDDGDPKVKGKRRGMMIALLRRQIAQEIPKATFIAVNPTHYAVAIRYDRGSDPVPKVLAKGVDGLALFIKELAKEHGIPIVEDPPLARELYARVEEGKYIPKDMFISIITLLHYLRATKQIQMK